MKKLILFVALLGPASWCLGQEINIRPAKAGGVYAVGEKIVWNLEVTGDGAGDIRQINYVLKKGMLTEMKSGQVKVKGNKARITTKLNEPGNILAAFSAPRPSGQDPIKANAGAVVDPDNIKPSSSPPADFDAFWQSKLQELAQVPTNPVLEQGESGNSTVDYWKITLDNIRGSKIQGQVARPKAGQKLPALLIVQWAGVYPLSKDWATNRAQEGWLTLNINAHDLPIDAPAEYYKNLKDLQNYPAIGNTHRDSSYFLRMYLSCYQAAQYLASRPDWDGQTLVVMGTSQGGLQALMLGGLHPQVTAVLANVPAGCDQTGPEVGRQSGWPKWYQQTKGKDANRVMETAQYYDVVHFARNITSPALVSVGLLDDVCPPPGVIAAYNLAQGPKELVVMEFSDHHGRNNTQAPYNERAAEWLRQLAAGKKVPAKK